VTSLRGWNLARIRALVLVPFLAIVLALVTGAVIMILSSPLVDGFDLTLPITAYVALFRGAFGSFDAIVETLTEASPLILAGFAVGIGFKAGLFNIGAQGQFLVGALTATATALALDDASPAIAIPASLIAAWPAACCTALFPACSRRSAGPTRS
jgi:simple sugar transport system permease protein